MTPAETTAATPEHRPWNEQRADGHVLPAERDAFEQSVGVTYCRRCGRPVVNDTYPDMRRPACDGPVPVTLRMPSASAS